MKAPEVQPVNFIGDEMMTAMQMDTSPQAQANNTTPRPMRREGGMARSAVRSMTRPSSRPVTLPFRSPPGRRVLLENGRPPLMIGPPVVPHATPPNSPDLMTMAPPMAVESVRDNEPRDNENNRYDNVPLLTTTPVSTITSSPSPSPSRLRQRADRRAQRSQAFRARRGHTDVEPRVLSSGSATDVQDEDTVHSEIQQLYDHWLNARASTPTTSVDVDLGPSEDRYGSSAIQSGFDNLQGLLEEILASRHLEAFAALESSSPPETASLEGLRTAEASPFLVTSEGQRSNNYGYAAGEGVSDADSSWNLDVDTTDPFYRYAINTLRHTNRSEPPPASYAGREAERTGQGLLPYEERPSQGDGEQPDYSHGHPTLTINTAPEEAEEMKDSFMLTIDEDLLPADIYRSLQSCTPPCGSLLSGGDIDAVPPSFGQSDLLQRYSYVFDALSRVPIHCSCHCRNNVDGSLWSPLDCKCYRHLYERLRESTDFSSFHYR